MQKKIVCALYALLWFCFAAWCLVASVLDVGTDEILYSRLQIRAGVLESAGVSDYDLSRLNERLVRCLEGRQDWNSDWTWDGAGKAFQVTVDGVERDAFNAREIAHMEDCARIFACLRTARRILTITIVLLGSVALIVRRRMRIKIRGRALVVICTLIFCIPFAALGIWAAVDFHSAFAFFHRCLFSNDLWLLNPETDLLIRICPNSMFEAMGLRIARDTALPLLAILLYAYAPCIEKRLMKRKKKRNEIADCRNCKALDGR